MCKWRREAFTGEEEDAGREGSEEKEDRFGSFGGRSEDKERGGKRRKGERDAGRCLQGKRKENGSRDARFKGRLGEGREREGGNTRVRRMEGDVYREDKDAGKEKKEEKRGSCCKI